VATLDVNEELPFQARFRRIQQAAAALAVLLLLAALLGVFGTGPLAHATATSAGGLRVEYDRFVRAEASTTLTISLPEGEGKTNVALSRDFLDKTDIAQVTPDPDSVTALPDRVVYTIDQHSPAQVQMSITPVQMGIRHATVYGPHGQTVHFTQIVYP
jgi:hypothetical protein